MIGITWKDFVDDAYFGTACFFKYHNKKFFYEIYSGCKNQQKLPYQCVLIQFSNENDKIENTLLKYYSKTLDSCFQQFLEAKVFDGHTIEEVEAEIEFIKWC